MTSIRIANIKTKWPLSLSTTQQINALIKTKKDSHWMTYDIFESGQLKKKSRPYCKRTMATSTQIILYFKNLEFFNK